MKDDESIYRIFEDLLHFLEKQAEQLQTRIEAAPSVVPEMIDEDMVFSEAMKDVKRLTRGKPRINSAPQIHETPTKTEKPDLTMLEKTLDESYRLDVHNLPEYMEGCCEDINPLTMDKLRNGEFSVQKVLDLHGYGAEEAEILFEEFLKDAIRSNLRCIRVIHGRGLKSKAGPVLKTKLKDWIMRAMHRKWITGFSSAQMGEGGPGATNILIRKRPIKKGFRIVG